MEIHQPSLPPDQFRRLRLHPLVSAAICGPKIPPAIRVPLPPLPRQTFPPGLCLVYRLVLSCLQLQTVVAFAVTGGASTFRRGINAQPPRSRLGARTMAEDGRAQLDPQTQPYGCSLILDPQSRCAN